MRDGSWSTATVVCVDEPPRSSSGDEPPRLALVAQGGRVVSDGSLVAVIAFRSASSALEAAMALQRERAGDAPVRVGIACGDLARAPDDRGAAAVFAARRLHQRAAPGQILATTHVLALARGVVDAPCRVLGNGGGDGLEVLWSPRATSAATAALPAPLSIAVTTGERFVGRENEWAELERAWNDVLIGAHRVVLVSGDVGAGKTRLAAEFAAMAHRMGALVLYGGCDRDVRVPYQPWGYALESLVTDPELGPDDAIVALRRDIAAIWPSAAPTPARATTAAGSAGADRFRVFAAVRAVLSAAARSQPVLIVLDDLHWAGPRSLALLRHLARTEACPNTLVIGTYGDAGVEHGDALVSWLADVHRLLSVVRVRLGRLDESAVGTLLAGDAAAHSPALRSLAAEITERSGGNAFYVLELWRHLVETGMVQQRSGRLEVRTDLLWPAVPVSVREVFAPRLRHLSERALELVQVAAVAGERFDLDVVREATSVDDDDLDRALDELAEAGLLVRPMVTAYDGRHAYQFAHRLVRDTVLDSMPPLMRARLHLRVAEAIERVRGDDPHPTYAELARHYGEAAAFAGHEKAVHYERCAAEQAMRAAAYDEAIAHLASALDRVNAESADHVELALDLATAQLRRGFHAESVRTSAEAFDCATQLRVPVLVGRAALVFEQASHMRGLRGGEAAERVRAALSVVDHDEVALRARLHASLARALVRAGQSDAALATIDHALVIARHVDDDEVLAHALESASVALTDPDRLLHVADELSELAGRAGDVWRLSYAESNRFRVEVALGDLDAAAETLARHRRLAQQGRSPMFELMTLSCEVVLAVAAGRFDDAEAAAERSHALGADDTSFDAGVYGLQMLVIRREQGRSAEVLPLVGELAASRPEPVWRAALAAAYADLGMIAEARCELDAFDGDALANLPRDWMWPAVASLLADATVVLRDERRAQLLAADLGALAGRNAMAGMTVCLGPVDRSLAGLAALVGREGAAEAHFRVARELAERSHSPVWCARVDHDWSRFLERRDPRRAHELGVRARREADGLGMAGVGREPLPLDLPLLVRRRVPAPGGGSLSAREVDVLRLVAVGCSNREIGVRLFISSNTAANHIRSILQKTGCANRAQAVAYGARHHLLDDVD